MPTATRFFVDPGSRVVDTEPCPLLTLARTLSRPLCRYQYAIRRDGGRIGGARNRIDGRDEDHPPAPALNGQTSG